MSETTTSNVCSANFSSASSPDAGHADHVTRRLEHAHHRPGHHRLVVHRQHPQRTRRFRSQRRARARRAASTDASTSGNAMRKVVPVARRRADLDVPAVLLDDAEHHRQTQAGATFAFGGEERLEHARLDLGAHAHARIGDLDDALPVLGQHPQADRAARRAARRPR